VPRVAFDVGTTGQAFASVDPTTNELSVQDPVSGYVRGSVTNVTAPAAQTPAAGVRTFIAGSAIAVPKNKLQVGTQFRWRFNATKTAAGSAPSTIDVCVGTTGTVADSAQLSFAKPAGSAVADEAWFEVCVTVQGPISAAGKFIGELIMVHGLAATGHALIPCVVVAAVSGTFDLTPAGLIVGLCITSGAGDVLTLGVVMAEAWNL